MTTRDHKEDTKSDHGRGQPNDKGQPADHGRPVKPHRSSAQVFGRNMKPYFPK